MQHGTEPLPNNVVDVLSSIHAEKRLWTSTLTLLALYTMRMLPLLRDWTGHSPCRISSPWRMQLDCVCATNRHTSANAPIPREQHTLARNRNHFIGFSERSVMGATDYTCSLAFRGTLICMVNGLKLTKDDSGKLAS